jgi:O-antigen ligase
VRQKILAKLDRRWLLGRGPLFDASFVLFTAAALLVRPTALWGLLFYLLVIPTFLRALWSGDRGVARAPESALVTALLAYFAVSILWSADADSSRKLKYAVGIATNGMFIAAAVAFFRDGDERLLRAFLPAVLIAAAINLVLSFGIHLVEAGPTQRLEGWAETRNSVLGALVISLIFSLLLVRAACKGKADWQLVALGLALLAFIALTRSRSAMLTAAIAAAVALSYPGRRTVMMIIAAAALPAIVVLAAAPVRVWDTIAELAERADSSRLAIWQAAWQEIVQRPIFGHGLANVFPVAEPFSHPHSLYLSSLYYGGIIGFLLLIALLASLAFRVLGRIRGSAGLLFALLLAHVVLVGAFDLAQIFREVSEQWLLLWLPIAMIIGLSARQPNSGQPASAHHRAALLCGAAAQSSAATPMSMTRRSP